MTPIWRTRSIQAFALAVLAVLPAPEAPGGRGALLQRRDTLKMAVEIAGKGTDIHKWAALEKTQVFPVKPLVNLMLITATVATILFVMALLLYLLTS